MIGETILSEAPSILFTHAIQLTCLIAVVWGICRTFASNRPHLAHALWALVLLKAMTPPLIAFPASPFSWGLTQIKASSTTTTPLETRPALASEQKLEAWKQTRKLGTSKLLPYAQPPTSFESAPSNLIPVSALGPAPRSNPATLQPSSSWGQPLQVLAWIWAGGALLCFLGILSRVIFFAFRVRRASGNPSSDTLAVLQETVADMSLPKRLAKPNRICIVDLPVGPAVIGLLKPCILLPRSLERECSHTELRMLIAHELTHIRRGDLWWAAIQILAISWWWFHPLVHFVNRLFNRATEMSCDEETIARLGCQPQVYARSLVTVLERKHHLGAAPALPGVRPMDVTLKRMERIMTLSKSGIRRRQPWWVLGLLLVSAAFALPGAELIKAQTSGSWNTGNATDASEYPTQQSQPLAALPALPTLSQPSQTAILANRLPILQTPEAPQKVQSFDAKQPLAKIQAQHRLSIKEARAYLASALEATTAAGTKIIIDEKNVVVQGSEKALETIEQNLSRMVELGFTEQIAVTTQFCMVDKELFGSLGLQWSLMPSEERNAPVVVCLADEAQISAATKRMFAGQTANAPQASRVVTLNGQPIVLEDSVERPFVVQPASQTTPAEVNLEKDGYQVHITPTFEGEAIRLEVAYEYSKVLGVNNFTFGSASSPQTVQVPDVEELTFQTQVTIPMDQTLAFAMPQRESPDQVHLFMLNARLIDQDAHKQPQASFPKPGPPGLIKASTVRVQGSFAPAAAPEVTTWVAPPETTPNPFPQTLDQQFYGTAVQATAFQATPLFSPQSADMSVIWWFKADGPPVKKDVQERCTQSLQVFDVKPRLYGDWNMEAIEEGDATLHLSGSNISVGSLDDYFEIVCERGSIVFDAQKKLVIFSADDGQRLQCRMAQNHFEAEQLTILEAGLKFSGNTTLSVVPESDSDSLIKGTADMITINADLCRIQGNAEIQVQDMHASADEILLNLEQNSLLLNGNVSAKREGKASKPLTVETDYLDVDLGTMTIKLGN